MDDQYKFSYFYITPACSFELPEKLPTVFLTLKEPKEKNTHLKANIFEDLYLLKVISTAVCLLWMVSLKLFLFRKVMKKRTQHKFV